MNRVYTLEPPTTAKVSLKTTVGDIDIELWTKECPKTCQNFIQLCLEGYYDNTTFHRVIKGFVVHGGDPNGDGSGGESIYGEPFQDEFHRRLRYTRRGLVGMLNFGKNDNGSQFFFTLAATPDLQNKNTLFGKVTDDTIFNMLRLEVGSLDQNKRPINLQKILRTEVISNPFDEILPNVTEEEPKNIEMKIKLEKRMENFGVLSCDDQSDEDEEDIKALEVNSVEKMMSIHDIVDDPRLSEQTIKIENLSDDRLVSETEEFAEEGKDITVEYNDIKMEDSDSDDDMHLTQEEENKIDDINRRYNIKKRKYWTQSETMLFLRCYLKRKNEFVHSRKKRIAYSNVLKDMLSQNVWNKRITPICLESKMRSLLQVYKAAIDNNRKAGPNMSPYMELMDKIYADSPIIQNPHTMHIGFGQVEITEENSAPSSPLNLSEATQSRPQSPSSPVESSLLSASSGLQISLPSSSSGVQISLPSSSASPTSTQTHSRNSTVRGRYFEEKLKIKRMSVELKAKQRDQALKEFKALIKKKWDNEAKVEQKKLTLLESILNSQN